MYIVLYCIVLYICLFQTRGPYKKKQVIIYIKFFNIYNQLLSLCSSFDIKSNQTIPFTLVSWARSVEPWICTVLNIE